MKLILYGHMKYEDDSASLRNVMPLRICEVRIIRVISVRKSGRVEQLNILLTELGRVFHNIR